MSRLTKLSIQALDKWGKDTQILKAVCELNELSLALLHYREGKTTEEEVLTEIADVTIMLRQLELTFHFLEGELKAEIERKLNNLESILNKQ